MCKSLNECEPVAYDTYLKVLIYALSVSNEIHGFPLHQTIKEVLELVFVGICAIVFCIIIQSRIRKEIKKRLSQLDHFASTVETFCH